MWLEKLLDTISQFLSIDPLAGIDDKIADLNPDKIYIENVRSLLDVSHPVAVKICETAVQRKVFDKQVEVLDPDGNVALIVNSTADIPQTIEVMTDDSGDPSYAEIPTKDLKKTVFYRLHDSSSLLIQS